MIETHHRDTRRHADHRFRSGLARIWLIALGGVLAAPSVLAQSLILGGSSTGASFYSGYRFNTHYANGYYWTALKDATCSGGRLRVYSSPDGSTWSQATGSPAFGTFCPAEGEWAVRFLGNVIVAFAYNGGNNNRYYSKGTLNSNGTITWQKQEDPAGLPTVATDTKLNAAIVNNKPVLWGADAASAGRVSIGSSLDSPIWTNVTNPTALTAGLNNNGSNGQFSAGAVFPLRGADPNDFIIIRATSLTTKAANDRAHRVVTIKFHAATNTFDTIWYNLSTLGSANPPNLAENATTEVSLGTDDVVQTRFAAAQMADGIIHVVYVNQNGNLVHYRRGMSSGDEVSLDVANKPLWTQHFDDTSNLDGAGAAVDKVGLTVIDSNNLYLLYSRVGSPATLYYRRFDGRAWGAETTIRASVTLNYSFGAMETATGCDAGVAWNEGTGPYSVYFRAVNPSCTGPTVFYRSIGTNSDYNTGRVDVNNSSKTVDAAPLPDPQPTWQTANRGLGDVIVIPCGNPPTCTGGVAYTISSVNTETRLTLTTAFSGVSGRYTYLIQRQFQSAAGNAAQAVIDWENCIDGGPCTNATHLFNPGPAASGNLVNANRVEVGVVYRDSIIQPALGGIQIRGTETSARHTIVLTAAPGNRHNGTPAAVGCTTNCASVVYDGGSLGRNSLRIFDANVTVSWIEFRAFRGWVTGDPTSLAPIEVVGQSDTTLTAAFPTGTEVAQNTVLSQLLIHDFADSDNAVHWAGLRMHSSCCKSLTVRNTMIWDGDRRGIEADEAGEPCLVENATIDYMHGFDSSGNPDARGIDTQDSVVTVRNTIATTNTANRDFFVAGVGAFSSLSTNNISSTGTPPGSNPLTATAVSLYISPASPGPANLHLKGPGANVAVDSGVDLSSSFVNDIDFQSRPAGAGWDRGADERDATTAVTLVSFSAQGLDSAVDLSWQTGSELSNLGFHLYRSSSSEGPYERITSAVIPGLGSSPVGASYSYRDSGLANGVTYFYRLEDIETTGETKLHGPVQATPQAGLAAPLPGGGSESSGGDTAPSSRIRYGDPSRNALRVVRQGPHQVILELQTEGFTAVPQADGSVRIEVAGFEDVSLPGSPSIPAKRTWVEAVAGRGVHLSEVRAVEVAAFSGLRPVPAGALEMVVGGDGTVRAGLRRRGEGAAFRRPGLYPGEPARVVEVAFQGEVKKALLELSPLRWDPASQQLLLARRFLVRVAFAGVEPSERSLGASRGRRHVEMHAATRGTVLAQLLVREKGLYGVSFEEVFGTQRRGVSVSKLRLSRQGQAAAFHVEPETASFGPGSVLYFVSEGASLNPYGEAAVYELELASGGLAMPVGTASPSGAGVSAYRKLVEFEANRTYQSALLDAPDPWLWEGVISPGTKSYPFTITALASSTEPTSLEVLLQGASDFVAAPDHHVRISLNGVVVGEASWDGKLPQTIEAELPSGLLQEGANQLLLQNVGDTAAAYSYVFLDKFSLSYPRRLEAEGGVLWGSFSRSGGVEVVGLGAGAVLDTTDAVAKWLLGSVTTGSALSFAVEAGRSYLAAALGSVLRPEVRKPLPTGLRNAENRADYLLIGPAEFLPETEPLLERRRSQGLVAKAVSVEDVYQEFGHGETTPEAVREFLSYAYHHWQQPSVRYVVLFGDGTYDFKNHLKTGRVNRVVPRLVRTSYMWTASDPSYASVNGEDLLPDLAIGRLSAGSVEEARALVGKVLGFEDAGLDFSGPAVLVSDNADVAGEFERESDEIGAMLGGREVEKIYLRDLGASGVRTAVIEAFNRGASLMSYVGHGGVAVWASENVFNNLDVASLVAQPRQPFLMTMNCLNGYFHGPGLDSLSEVLVKAADRGAAAVFSPTGLSVSASAHRYQQALVRELTSGRHERLGDAILAAQAAYADAGAMPELLSIYHLLGDPALRIR